MNSENPYASPADQTSDSLKRKSIGELRDVAMIQKGLIACMAINLLTICPFFATGLQFEWLLYANVFGVFLVFGLVIKPCHWETALLLVFAGFIPCIGTIVLLISVSLATRVLKENGLHVGIFGADVSQLNR